MKQLFLIAATIFICGCLSSVVYMAQKSDISISSPAFQHNQMMPRKFTCQGDDINPPLAISNVPNGTRSLALIMDDPDAPTGWDHWIMWNISPDTKMINEDSVPEDAVQGLNSWGNNSYGGPCPPSGTHRYLFKLYALDRELDLENTSAKHAVESAMQGHILGQTQLIGLYKKT